MRQEIDLQVAIERYQRARSTWTGSAKRRGKKQKGKKGEAFKGGRDPQMLGSVLSKSFIDFGWDRELSRAAVLSAWPELVGDRIAPHTEVIAIRKDSLEVQCDSTSWTTELRRLKHQIFTRIIEEYPAAEIEDLKFIAPGAPSWRHGPRVMKGLGPRDTYG